MQESQRPGVRYALWNSLHRLDCRIVMEIHPLNVSAYDDGLGHPPAKHMTREEALAWLAGGLWAGYQSWPLVSRRFGRPGASTIQMVVLWRRTL